jgi:hypothetical protein
MMERMLHFSTAGSTAGVGIVDAAGSVFPHADKIFRSNRL